MNSSKPLVEVVIPLFNQKQFVGQAIESILNQSYPNIEIIVVNDGSTDKPSSVLEKYENNIMVVDQENKGLSAARNTGIRHSSGEYLQFLDADDILHRDKIKLQLELSKNRHAMISYCEIAQYENDTRRTSLNYIGEIRDMFPHLYNLWHPYPLPIHSLLMSREIFEQFGSFDEELKANEDRHFLSKIAASKTNFEYFPLIGGFRRLHKHNMNKDKLHVIRNTIEYYRKINAELGDEYIIGQFGYTGYQMMCANMTYLYLANIATGSRREELEMIRKLLRLEDINLYAKPIPWGPGKFKLKMLFLHSYLIRLKRYEYFVKRSLKGILR
jgi:glycosyltransferase involved in cell wall biosynthesis